MSGWAGTPPSPARATGGKAPQTHDKLTVMKQAFALTVLLIGVLVAIFVLKRQSEQAPRHRPSVPLILAGGDAGAPVEVLDGGPSRGPRVVALTRLVPRYALALPTAQPEIQRGDFLGRLAHHGGRVVGELPARARAPLWVEVPPAAFKPLLRDLGVGKTDLRLRALPSRPSTDPRTPVQLEISFPEP
jgi:hypothetical protein